MADLSQMVLSLRPETIKNDPEKCTQDTSLYHQIINNSKATLKRQVKQFNLGNDFYTANPIEAADFILKREYSDSSLFDDNKSTSVFIPPTFISNQYKKSATAVLDYDIKKNFDKLLDNLNRQSPTDWLSIEFKAFMATQNGDYIDKKSFDQWKLNLQIMYLVSEEMKPNQVPLEQSTTFELSVFVPMCIEVLLDTSTLKKELKDNLSNILEETFLEKLKKVVKQRIKRSPPSDDSNLNWLFGLGSVEIGERIEHWFYDQLLWLKDDTLQNTVVLSGPDFYTNLRRRDKQNKEIDFLIISWERKLIISIEFKRTLIDDKAFEQLKSTRRFFEEGLGDQFKSEWKYFPVVGVENDKLSLGDKSLHYITMDTKIKPWLTSIFKEFQIANSPTTSTSTARDEVKNLLKILVFSIHKSERGQVLPITASTWVEYASKAIESVSTSHNILFYSNQQMALMNNDDPRYRKVIIRGKIGSGKSILLQHKAIQLNGQTKYKEKVMFVVVQLTGEIEPMHYHRSRDELGEKGIFVDELNLSKKSSDLEDYAETIKTKKIKAVFIDEFDVAPATKEFIKELATFVDFLWVVPSTESLKKQNFEEWSKTVPFVLVDLDQNFRNSVQIVKETNRIAGKEDYRYKEGIAMPLGNSPGGCAPIFVDSFNKAVRKARKRSEKGGILVIAEYRIEKIDVYLDELKQLNENGKMYCSHKNDFLEGTERPYQFLKAGNVLIIDGRCSFGFDWTTIIFIEHECANETYHSCNFMLRCTTNLIVVKKEKNEIRDNICCCCFVC
ncbi:uncharacterized protein [Clytia hemisphaerica]|uniref:uncharacterized protein n=1 Tax=Clytia hemisphaerica TaxID=252671 RepID=UPI0034D76A24